MSWHCTILPISTTPTVFSKMSLWRTLTLRFTVQTAEEGNAFVPLLNAQLDDILCLKARRTVNNDNCVTYQTKRLQIPKTSGRCHYAKASVNVHEYQDGKIGVFHGPRLLGTYDLDGNLEEKEVQVESKQAANG